MSKTVYLYKTIAVILACLVFSFVPFIFCACTENNKNDELLRLHIRAHSNDIADQEVKLKVRDAINEYVSENVNKTTFDEAYEQIGGMLDTLSDIAREVLEKEGFYYGARAVLDNEYFPTRIYGSLEVKEGYYDALVIELGDAKGDNWWCVIYPPLCYGEDFEYKSIFAELFGD